VNKSTVNKLKKLKALMIKISRRKEPGYSITTLDCGTYACVDGWAARAGLTIKDSAEFLAGFNLTHSQRVHICWPNNYNAEEYYDPRAAARHIQQVINGEIP